MSRAFYRTVGNAHIDTDSHLILWFGFGTTKIRLTQGVGPTTCSIMSSRSRRASSTSTFFRWWKGIRLCCGIHVGWIEWSMYKCICRSLSLPIPFLRTGYLTNLSLTVLTWLRERCNRPNVFAVWPLNRFPWSPLTTTKSVVVDLSAECKTSRNWPSTGITVPPYPRSFLSQGFKTVLCRDRSRNVFSSIMLRQDPLSIIMEK